MAGAADRCAPAPAADETRPRRRAEHRRPAAVAARLRRRCRRPAHAAGRARRRGRGAGTRRRRLCAAEGELLATYADVQALFRRRGGDAEDEEEGGEGLGTEEYLLAYLRTRGRGTEQLPERFLDRLAQAVAHYGVASLDPSPALDAALFRLYGVPQRAAQAATVVRSVLERWLIQRDALAPQVGALQRRLLDRIMAVTQGRDETLSALAREVHYRFFDEPLSRCRARTPTPRRRRIWTRFARGAGDGRRTSALVECSQSLTARIAPRPAAVASGVRCGARCSRS